MGLQLEDKKEFEECVDKKDIFDGDAPLFDTTKPPGDSFLRHLPDGQPKSGTLKHSIFRTV